MPERVVALRRRMRGQEAIKVEGGRVGAYPAGGGQRLTGPGKTPGCAPLVIEPEERHFVREP